MSDSKEQQLWDASALGNLDIVMRLANDPAVNVNWGDPQHDRTAFYRACGHGCVSVVEFLLKHPNVDAKKLQSQGGSPLYIACQEGHTEVVSLLLKDMRVDVNFPMNAGHTPFNIACEDGRTKVVSLLLADTRIDINKPEKTQRTPLYMASQNCHLPLVQLILASGREIDTKTKSIAGPAAWNDKTASEIARFQGIRAKYTNESEEDYSNAKQNGPLIAALIDSFEADPATTRKQLRELPELRDSFISDLFALVIFLCDELLKVNAESSASSLYKAARFFRIAQSLPIELQMMLCNHVFGAGKNNVLTKHSEPAFKKLGRWLAMSESG